MPEGPRSRKTLRGGEGLARRIGNPGTAGLGTEILFTNVPATWRHDARTDKAGVIRRFATNTRVEREAQRRMRIFLQPCRNQPSLNTPYTGSIED